MQLLVAIFVFPENPEKDKDYTCKQEESSEKRYFYLEDETITATLVELFLVCLYDLDEDKLKPALKREVKIVLYYIAHAMDTYPSNTEIHYNSMKIIDEVRGGLGNQTLINMGVVGPLQALLRSNLNLPVELIKKGRALYFSLCSDFFANGEVQTQIRGLKENDIVL